MSAVPSAFKPLFAEIPSSVPPEVVCHCVQVTRDEVEAVIEAGAETVKCVVRETGAGGGCTACHCTIRNLLEAAGRAVICRTPRFADFAEERTAVAG